MADKANELQVEKETSALKKLQSAAGFVDKTSVERLDWMYEQSFFEKSDQDKLMNTPVQAQSDKDTADVKQLQESTAGSLFLKSATKTTEDMLRKLREDPLFQIRRQEEAARASMMANPLVVARLKKKADKEAKRVGKKAKKAMKKQKKAEKKLAKAQQKLDKKVKKKKKSSSSSSDSSDSDDSGKPAAPKARKEEPPPRSPPRKRESSPPRRRKDHSPTRSPKRRRASSPAKSPPRKRESSPPRRRKDASPARSPPRRRASSPAKSPRRRSTGDEDLCPLGNRDEALGPSGKMVNKREEYAAIVEERKVASLASRGAPRRMSDEEKLRRIEQMQTDAKTHERSKDVRIAEAVRKDKEVEELEKRMRNESNQSYFREIRQETYMGDKSGSLADRIGNQRQRRSKNLNDPLERDDK